MASYCSGNTLETSGHDLRLQYQNEIINLQKLADLASFEYFKYKHPYYKEYRDMCIAEIVRIKSLILTHEANDANCN
jgi:hypothetical protein